MSETASQPPTPRRRALARAAGQVPLSRALVAAAAWAGATAALAWAGGQAAQAIAAMARADVMGAAAAADPVARATAVGTGPLAAAAQLAAPFAIAAALLALLAHFGQTRALWLPRRRIRGAPEPRGHASRRAVDAAVALAGAAAVLAATGRVAWLHAGDLVRAGASARGLAIGAAGAAEIAAVLVVAAVLDWAVRALRHLADLRMTPGERRQDERASSADPRWARLRREREREASVLAVDGSAIVIADDRAAAAIRWDARWHPVPRVAVAGADRLARSLVAAARRRRVPVQHDAGLAEALARLPAGAAVPRALHDRLAQHLAAIGR